MADGVGVDGNAEEDEVGVGYDDLGSCVGEVEAGAVDAEVGDMWRAGGAEGHLNAQAGARGTLSRGGVDEVGDVAPPVEEDQS